MEQPSPYLHLQLLGFRVVDQEGVSLLPDRLIGFISGLKELKDTTERRKSNLGHVSSFTTTTKVFTISAARSSVRTVGGFD